MATVLFCRQNQNMNINVNENLSKQQLGEQRFESYDGNISKLRTFA